MTTLHQNTAGTDMCGETECKPESCDFFRKCWRLTDVLRVKGVKKLGSDNEGTWLYRQKSGCQFSKNFSATSADIFGIEKIHRGCSLAGN